MPRSTGRLGACGLHDAVARRATGQAGPHMADHLELPRQVVEHFADVLADLDAASCRRLPHCAARIRGLMHHHLARQVGWQARAGLRASSACALRVLPWIPTAVDSSLARIATILAAGAASTAGAGRPAGSICAATSSLLAGCGQSACAAGRSNSTLSLSMSSKALA
jgi:hypothetical protein